ncbi:MAG: LytTR family DNA-binding domain-containing protein [Carboxylicivirga sp.]|nr:LytTR family DNA-binding domain-containing protein [Carboxylicivirga sp.]
MIKSIIIEDQEPAQRILKKYLSDTNDVELIGVFRDALSALDFLKQNPVDLIFLDIHLPKLSGMDFLSVVSPRPQIILTTAFTEYAIESYEFDVTDYLLKPFSFERFIKAVYKVKKQLAIAQVDDKQEEQDKNILIKVGHDHVRIAFADIMYIKADGDYTQVYTNQKRFMVLQSLKYWMDKVPNKNFCQIHRSCIINAAYIQKFTSNTVYIADEALPVGRVYKKSFTDLFEKLRQ